MKSSKIDFMDFPYTDRNGVDRLMTLSYKLWFTNGKLDDVSNINHSILPKNSMVFSHFKDKYDK